MILNEFVFHRTSNIDRDHCVEYFPNTFVIVFPRVCSLPLIALVVFNNMFIFYYYLLCSNDSVGVLRAELSELCALVSVRLFALKMGRELIKRLRSQSLSILQQISLFRALFSVSHFVSWRCCVNILSTGSTSGPTNKNVPLTIRKDVSFESIKRIFPFQFQILMNFSHSRLNFNFNTGMQVVNVSMAPDRLCALHVSFKNKTFHGNRTFHYFSF